MIGLDHQSGLEKDPQMEKTGQSCHLCVFGVDVFGNLF